MTTIEIEEKDNSWVIPVQDRSVTQCIIDYQFSIQSWRSEVQPWVPGTEGSQIYITIGGEFTFQHKNQRYIVDADENPPSVCPALAILHKQIESITIYKNGHLEVVFSEDYRIDVPPDDQYEAWDLNATGGLHIVCMPGGELAIWI